MIASKSSGICKMDVNTSAVEAIAHREMSHGMGWNPLNPLTHQWYT
jgi:hypothetical protein